MNDRQIVEYLRARGAAAPPPDLMASVMAAVDEAPEPQSWFRALPVLAAAGAAAVIVAVALLIGPFRDIGPAPGPTGTPAPTDVEATLAELDAAVTAATERLAESPAVRGRHIFTIGEHLASATWFDWRPSGDQVVVTRDDIDVRQPWWTDPDGEPLTVGERVEETIHLVVGDSWYRSEGGPWVVEEREDVAPTLTWAIAMLTGAVPSVPPDASDGDALVTRRVAGDGGVLWTLELATDEGQGTAEWHIGADGVLVSYSLRADGLGLDPATEHAEVPTAAEIVFDPTEDPAPIPEPDMEASPDPAAFGYPADMPLDATGDGSTIDYRAYVEDALDALEAYHWNSASIDWAVARSAALDGLPEEPTADQAHARIRRAIETFDAFNTVFVRPQDVPPGGMGDGGSASGEMPAGERIGEIGIVALPTPPSDGTDVFVDYLETAWAAMATVEDSAPACGWLIDLRDYDGFAWGPSMYALGGLLGDGRVATFRSPAGEWWLEVNDEGVISSGGFDEADDPIDSPYIETFRSEVQRDRVLANAIAALTPHIPSMRDAPVAVLVGNATRSGGEQTLVAFIGREATRTFGGPTSGTPVVAPNYRMADGAVLRIPTWIPVDRTGAERTTNITPDEVIGDTRASGSDAIRDAAVDWLETQPSCS